MANFMINGTAIKNPSTFKIERYNVTTMERLANADMAGDLVAKKLKFYFTYDAISAEEFNTILSAIWDTNSLFYTLTYIENGTTKTATVYVGSIPAELHRTGGNSSSWIWKDLSFNLIQK